MGKAPRTRPDRCRRKTSFSSIGSAQQFIAQRLLKQVAYRCNVCGSYHLTKAKPTPASKSVGSPQVSGETK